MPAGDPKSGDAGKRTWWNGPIGSVELREGEIEIWLPDMKINAAVPAALDRRELPGQIGFDGAVIGR